MRRTKLNPVSSRQKIELDLRRRIKAELISEQLKTVGFVYCVRCGQKPSWEGIDLSHKISLSRGGKTEIGNCQLLCRNCHMIHHKLKVAND